MTFQIAKSIRQFLPHLPQSLTLKYSTNIHLRPRLPSETSLVSAMKTLQCRNIQPLLSPLRSYGSRDENEPDSEPSSPLVFMTKTEEIQKTVEQNTLRRGKKLLKYILTTFETRDQTLGGRQVDLQRIQSSLSRSFFKSELQFYQHLISFIDSLSPLKSGGDNLIQAVQAYANCRSQIMRHSPHEPIFFYRNSPLTMVPPEITLLTKLETISFEDNDIKSLPSVLENPNKVYFPDLQSLYLDHNRISSVDSLLNHCPELSSLELSSNRFTQIPASLAKLNKLRILNISHNQIKSIHLEIFNRPLRYLDLSHNNLSTIPNPSDSQTKGGFKLLQSLIHLNLSSNSLQKFEAYNRYSKLETLNLSRNHIECFNFTRSLAPIIRHINLSSNHLNELNVEPQNLGKLDIQTLNLTDNPIQVIPPELLREIPTILKSVVYKPSPLDMTGC